MSRPGLSDEQLMEHQREMDARRIANATPLPGPAAAAFAGRPPRVGKLEFRDVLMDDFVILRELDNPLSGLLSGLLSGQAADPQFSEPQLRELTFLWTRPIDESEALLAKGADQFKAAAHRMRLGLKLSEIPLLAAAIGENVRRAFATVVQYGPKSEGMASFSDRPTRPPTASGGGSEHSAS
jgi:hypothetical protein